MKRIAMLVCCTAALVAAKPWHAKAWEALPGDTGVFAKGYFSKAHRMLLTNRPGCEGIDLQLVWDTFDPDVRDYLKPGNEVVFDIAVDGKSETLAFTLTELKDTADGIRLVFVHSGLDAAWTKRFRSGHDVAAKVTGSEGLVKRFDLAYDYFSLGGFTAASNHLRERCRAE